MVGWMGGWMDELAGWRERTKERDGYEGRSLGR